jgi:hypothetical protein
MGPWPKRPKIVCSPSYADIRSRANTTRGKNKKGPATNTTSCLCRGEEKIKE